MQSRRFHISFLLWRSATLVSLLFLSFFLKIFALGEKPFWYDELQSFMGSWVRSSFRHGLAASTGDLWGMLWGKLLLFGDLPITPFTLRLPSAVAGGLLVPLVYMLSPLRERLSLTYLFLLAPFAYYFSQEARPYAGALLCSTLVWLLLYRTLLEKRPLTKKEVMGLILATLGGGFFSPFFFLGCGMALLVLFLRTNPVRSGFFWGFLLLIFHSLYLYFWVSDFDAPWVRGYGFRLYPLSPDHFRSLFSWFLVSPDSGLFLLVAMGVFLCGLFSLLFEVPLFLITFLLSLAFIVSFFVLTQHLLGFRYLLCLLPATLLIVAQGVKVLARFFLWAFALPLSWQPVLCFLFMVLYTLPGAWAFYGSWFSLPLKPAMITSTHAGLHTGNLPFPQGNTVIFTGVRLEKGDFRFSVPEQLYFLNLVELSGMFFLYSEPLRHKQLFFLGGSRRSDPFEFGSENGYVFLERELRNYGYSFKLCYREEWQECLQDRPGPWEVYVDSFFLFRSRSLSPCSFIENNPCLYGIHEQGWTSFWKGALKPRCWKEGEIVHRSYGSALYLRIEHPGPEDVEKITDFYCFVPGEE